MRTPSILLVALAIAILPASCTHESDVRPDKGPKVAAPGPGDRPMEVTSGTPARPAIPPTPAAPGASAAGTTPASGGPASAAGSGAATAPEGTLRVSVLYRERMMLPPSATVKVQLVDVSKADAPAEVIAEASAPATTAPPFAFTLTFDPARIKPERRYAVQARIEEGGKLMFINDTQTSVLTGGGATGSVEVLVKRAGG